MGLREALDPDLVRIEADCRTKDGLLERIAGLVAAKVPGIDSTGIDEALRESTTSSWVSWSLPGV
jgi:hypothetical protein